MEKDGGGVVKREGQNEEIGDKINRTWRDSESSSPLTTKKPTQKEDSETKARRQFAKKLRGSQKIKTQQIFKRKKKPCKTIKVTNFP